MTPVRQKFAEGHFRQMPRPAGPAGQQRMDAMTGFVGKLGPVWKILAAMAVVASVSSCGPLIGGAAVVAADEAAEQDGDGGLF